MRRAAIKKGATVGKVDYTKLLEIYGTVCHICGGAIQDGNLHFDHVIPLSRGGSHSMDNIKPAHASCNQQKFNKII